MTPHGGSPCGDQPPPPTSGPNARAWLKQQANPAPQRAPPWRKQPQHPRSARAFPGQRDRNISAALALPRN
eukprot:7041368-Alexandrium_andersonii.AAC.1